MTTGLTRGASISFGRSRPLMSRSPCERVGPALWAFPHHFLNHRAPRSITVCHVPRSAAGRPCLRPRHVADRRALGLGRVGGIVLHKPDRLLVGLVVDLAPGLLGKLMGPLARTLVRFSRETGSNSCRNTGHLCCPASSPEEPDAVPQVLRPRLSRAKIHRSMRVQKYDTVSHGYAANGECHFSNLMIPASGSWLTEQQAFRANS